MADARLFLQLDRIEAKIDAVENRIGSIDTTLAGQHEQLVVHIKRTEILERELKPVISHVAQVKGAGKLLALLCTLATIAGALAIFWHKG